MNFTYPLDLAMCIWRSVVGPQSSYIFTGVRPASPSPLSPHPRTLIRGKRLNT